MDVNQQILNEMRVTNVLKILENSQLCQSLDNEAQMALVNFVNQYINVYKTQYMREVQEKSEAKEYEEQNGSFTIV